MVLRFHPKNPAVILAGTSEGQVLSCDISDFVNDGQQSHEQLQQIESCKDERWTEIIRGKSRQIGQLLGSGDKFSTRPLVITSEV